MQGKIIRIQVLWIDNKNPNKVKVRVNFMLSIISSFYRYDSKLKKKKSTFAVTVKTHNTTTCAKNYLNEKPVKYLLSCTRKNTFSSRF